MNDNTDDPNTQPPSPQTCQQVTEVIIDYLSGDMEAAATAAFERHLQGCRDCGAFFNTYQGTLRATRSLSYEQLPTELSSRVLRFLHQSIQDSSSSSS